MEDLQLQYAELQTKYDESQRQLKLQNVRRHNEK